MLIRRKGFEVRKVRGWVRRVVREVRREVRRGEREEAFSIIPLEFLGGGVSGDLGEEGGRVGTGLLLLLWGL